ncbi:PEP-CTERM sorting domain-containing protein [Massilia antarctica]|uniref:PEP-CTERM sorting domain-containing protein n=2 Tax=Massilia antarctica TaxID=2765360 RepID=A0AA48WIQ2_9BURK|nr:PEP-CTERM sorting domain-containing protein [Massilia antarctica]
MFEYNGATSQVTTVTESAMSGVQIANGYTVHGRFSFDTMTPLSSIYQPEQPAGGSYLLYSDAPANTTTLSFDQNGYTYRSRAEGLSSLIQVANRLPGQGADVFSLSTYNSSMPSSFESSTLNLFDLDGRAFGSGAIPTTLDLALFGYANIGYGWLRRADGSQVHANADLTSMRLVAAAVPEPDSWALMCLGIAVLGAAGARGRTRNAGARRTST